MYQIPEFGNKPFDPDKRDRLKKLLSLGVCASFGLNTFAASARDNSVLIDDFSNDDLRSKLGTVWRGVSDKVMGGVSDVSVRHEIIDGRKCLRLTGKVSLENNGGFIQAALDLAAPGEVFDASGYTGIRLIARGNGKQYSAHLRTPDNVRPWQSYRAQFIAGPKWQDIDLPFKSFVPYRIKTPLNVARLRRVGLVAIGREFQADLAISKIVLYR